MNQQLVCHEKEFYDQLKRQQELLDEYNLNTTYQLSNAMILHDLLDCLDRLKSNELFILNFKRNQVGFPY